MVARNLLCVLLSGVICQALGKITFRPYGPNLCKLVCEKTNCTTFIYDEVQLVCDITTNTNTSNVDCNIPNTWKEDNSGLSTNKCTIKEKEITKSSQPADAAYVKLFKEACEKGNLFEVRKIVCQGLVDINYRWKDGSTPVMIASKNGKTEIFDFLVKHECNLSTSDENENFVLHHACYGGSQDIVRKLIDNHHVDLECRNRFFKTPLMIAVQRGHKPVVELLKCKGADMNTETGCYQNVLHFACIGGNVQMVKYVLSRTGIDKDSIDCYGKTPLNLAVQHGYIEVVELLYKNKANMTTVDYSGNNVFHTACKANDIAMVEYLITFKELRGLQRIKNESGFTAIDLAEMMGYDNIVSLFT